jgi:cobalt-precorrin-6B (C15)-methyltransferase
MLFMNPDTNPMPPKGGPTKDEILAISLYKLGLSPDDIFADLGCGTGRISIEAAGKVKTVHAVDRRKEACEWIKQDAKNRGITNISIHYNENAAFLKSLNHLDTAFIGGTQSLDDVIRILAELNVRSIVINAVMLETVHIAVKNFRRYGIFKEVILAHISRSYPISSDIMLKPLDPVFIIHGGTTSC